MKNSHKKLIIFLIKKKQNLNNLSITIYCIKNSSSHALNLISILKCSACLSNHIQIPIQKNKIVRLGNISRTEVISYLSAIIMINFKIINNVSNFSRQEWRQTLKAKIIIDYLVRLFTTTRIWYCLRIEDIHVSKKYFFAWNVILNDKIEDD